MNGLSLKNKISKRLSIKIKTNASNNNNYCKSDLLLSVERYYVKLLQRKTLNILTVYNIHCFTFKGKVQWSQNKKIKNCRSHHENIMYQVPLFSVTFSPILRCMTHISLSLNCSKLFLANSNFLHVRIILSSRFPCRFHTPAGREIKLLFFKHNSLCISSMSRQRVPRIKLFICRLLFWKTKLVPKDAFWNYNSWV